MDRTVRIFDNQADADRADREYYAALTPDQRLEVLLDLIAAYRGSLGEAAERFERAHRIVELSQKDLADIEELD